MKKLQILFLAASISVLAASCYHRGRHVTIQSSNNGYITSLEYAGTVVFNKDETGISGMLPHSYFKYKRDNESMEAKCDNRGRITYEVNSEKVGNTLNGEGKSLLAEGIRVIVKTQGKKG